jgi:hypothetical protein
VYNYSGLESTAKQDKKDAKPMPVSTREEPLFQKAAFWISVQNFPLPDTSISPFLINRRVPCLPAN